MPKFMCVYRAGLLNIEHSGENDPKKAEVFFKLRDNAIVIRMEDKTIIHAKGETDPLEAHARTKGWL